MDPDRWKRVEELYHADAPSRLHWVRLCREWSKRSSGDRGDDGAVFRANFSEELCQLLTIKGATRRDYAAFCLMACCPTGQG